jgi:hypothetical protein
MAMAVAMTMCVAVAMTVEAMDGAAESSMDRAAMEPTVGTGYRFLAGAAAASWRKSHRHGADRSTPHQCQHDAARAFHGEAPRLRRRDGVSSM